MKASGTQFTISSIVESSQLAPITCRVVSRYLF